MTKQYRSEALAAAHEAALGLAEAGLMSKRTMRKFDEMCLTPVREMTPEDIRALRLREHASQAVFARYLNVTTGKEEGVVYLLIGKGAAIIHGFPDTTQDTDIFVLKTEE